MPPHKFLPRTDSRGSASLALLSLQVLLIIVFAGTTAIGIVNAASSTGTSPQVQVARTDRVATGDLIGGNSASTTSSTATSGGNATASKYIMAFLACDTSTANCSNPVNHKTYLAESIDGVAWSPLPGFTPIPGSVPDVIARGNTLYVYNPGRLTRYHRDTGVQESGFPVSIKYANGSSTTGFVDPSAILDGNGTIVLFYLPAILGQDPAQCPIGQTSCVKYVMSATEVADSDGASFVVDPGIRVGVQISTCCASDPSVFQGPSGYYLYVSEGQSVLAFASGSLRGAYSPVEGLVGGVLVQQGTGGVPAGYYDQSSRTFWTYVTQGQVSVIARASTPSINSSIPASSFSTVLSGISFPGLGGSYLVASPAIHQDVQVVTQSTTTATSTSTNTTSASISTSSTSTNTAPEFPSQWLVPTFLFSMAASGILLGARRGIRARR